MSVENFQKGSRSQNGRLQRTELRPRDLSVSCSFASICPEVSGLQDPQLWGEEGSGHLQPLLPLLEKIQIDGSMTVPRRGREGGDGLRVPCLPQRPGGGDCWPPGAQGGPARAESGGGGGQAGGGAGVPGLWRGQRAGPGRAGVRR